MREEKGRQHTNKIVVVVCRVVLCGDELFACIQKCNFSSVTFTIHRSHLIYIGWRSLSWV